MAMPFDETPERLDDHLNRLGSREGFEPREFGFEPMLAETVGRFHALDAGDREPEPDPIFLRRLEEDLMNAAISARVTRPARSGVNGVSGTAQPFQDVTAMDVVGTLVRSRPGRRIRWRGVSNLAVAAVILLMLATGYAAYRLAPSDGSEQTSGVSVVAPGATPTAIGAEETDAVDISECATEARPAGSVGALAGTEPGVTSILPRFNNDPVYVDYGPPLVDAALLLGGFPEADAETVAGVTATIRELTACRFYTSALGLGPNEGTDVASDYEGRYFALYSDDYFRRQFAGYREQGLEPDLGIVWIPFGPSPRLIEDARTMPDGRVVALVSAPDYGAYGRNLAVFTKQGDRWLVDELGQAAPDQSAAATPGPSARFDYPQYLEVTLTDIGQRMVPIPSAGAFRENKQVVVTLANFGTRPHRFQIEELGIDVEVQPGHSQPFAIVAMRGTYEVTTSVVGEDGQPYQVSTGELTFYGEGTPIPMG